jgi:phage replication O-like protein O
LHCIPGELIEEISKRDFSKRQQSILLLMARLTYGLGEDWAHIKNKKDLAAVTGIHWVDVYKEIQNLLERKVLQIEGKYHRINKNIFEWDIAKEGPAEKAAALDRLINNVLNKPKIKKRVVREILGETPKKINKSYQQPRGYKVGGY